MAPLHMSAIRRTPVSIQGTPASPRLDLALIPPHPFPLAPFSSSPHTPEPPPPWPSSFARSLSSSKPEVVPLDSVVARYFLYCHPLELGATTSPASSDLPPPAAAHRRFDLSPPSLPRACFAPLQVRDVGVQEPDATVDDDCYYSGGSTGRTPFFLVYGAEAVLLTDLLHNAPRVELFSEAEAEQAR
ncbi:uncharacterized protein [Triticum aestivum]|uniref:uncharacterized protein n=1 Tax=Triticum aestivum TaxID=4565 RepID=UPI001D007CE5|nr:uncharacterized protein LOC123191713 [Triticum aestivum]